MSIGTATWPVVTTASLSKVYGEGATAVQALDSVSVEFRAGEFTAIMGPSGSGKSTLLHCAAGLDSVSGGKIHLFDQDGRMVDLTELSDQALTKLRRDRIGFIFQSFNLLPTLTAEQNIKLPFELTGRRIDPQWYGYVVDVLGLADRLRHLPAELSGGQQQRVACARALLPRPTAIFADEPTGNLDSRAGGDLLDLLRRCTHELGQTIVMVTHDPIAACFADRVVFLADGRLQGDLHRPTRSAVLDRLRTLEG